MTEQDIVERLTDAQKRAMAEWTSESIAPWVSGAVIGALRKGGLLDKKRNFTPLGLSVRALLEKQNG